jgi:hypothetical protein
LLSFVERELTVGGTIGEVVQNFFDVLLAFQDARDDFNPNQLFIRSNWEPNKAISLSVR